MASSNTSPLKLLIIGNGLAAMQLLKELDRQNIYQIKVLSAEPVHHYNRIMLSSLLAEETNLASITPCDDEWYTARQTEVLLNHKVVSIQYADKQVVCANGKQFDYDKLVFATGSQSFIPNIPGTFLDQRPQGVMGFRELYDVDYMRSVAQQHQHAVVIGAGLLGIEAAVGLIKQGMKVTLLHRRDVIMNRQIDPQASGLLIEELTQRGIEVRTGNAPQTIHKSGDHVSSVELDNGDKLPADLVIFATGIVPCTQLAKHSGLQVNKGIVVDGSLQTSQSDVYALGECCEYQGNTYGLVAPIWNQAAVLAKRLLGKEATYQEEEFATKLKVSGIDVHSMGLINQADAQTPCEVLEYRDVERAIYKKILISDHKVVGAVLYGDVADSQWYYQLLQNAEDIQGIRSDLIFGQAFCTA